MFAEIYIQGPLLGLFAFFAIGIFHPIVVKAEYYFSKKIGWIFLLFGVILSSFSLFVEGFWSYVLGVFGFALFWSVLEIIEQHKRVLKGRAKRNPNRVYEQKNEQKWKLSILMGLF